MDPQRPKQKRTLEFMLIVIILGITAIFAQMGPRGLVVLNLFFVPIILSGYYLGRTSAGVQALFCAVSVAIGMALSPTLFTAYDSPALVGLALTLWAAVLGLCAILVGTLCDERAATVRDLHKAYVGVVEVLSKYLQGTNPRVKSRSVRIAELSQRVATALKLSRKETDDIRVAALLHDLENVEVTTQTISKAVDTLETKAPKHTFLGAELINSLGTVLEGALPLLVNQDDAVRDYLSNEDQLASGDVPIGARIISAVRAFDHLTVDRDGNEIASAHSAIERLRRGTSGAYDTIVINTIEQVAERPARAATPELIYN